MSSIEAKRFYRHPEPTKPQFTLDLSPDSVRKALEIARAYYSPGEQSFGEVIGPNSFYGLSEFLEQFDFDNQPSFETLKANFLKLPGFDNSSRFLKLSQKILAWMNKQEAQARIWKTCSYREEEACAQVYITINGQEHIIGAIASSGGHEFVNTPADQQLAIMAECIFIALGSRGFPVNEIDQDTLFGTVQSVAAQLLKSRIKYQSHTWDPNCKELNEWANYGADDIARHFEKQLTDPENYQTCLMHRYNPNYAESFQAQNIALPGEHGRLDCLSHCAESQAIFRAHHALQPVLLLGVKKAFVTDISSSSLIHKDGQPESYRQISFVTTRGSSKPSLKRLLIDEKLPSTMPGYYEENQTPFLLLGELFKQAKVSIERHQVFAVKIDGDMLTLSADNISSGKPYVNFQAGLKDVLRIPRSQAPTTTISAPRIANLYCHNLPCLHCLHTMDTFGVDNLYVQEIDWSAFKSDDVLILMWLLQQFPGEIRVGGHINHLAV